MKEIKVGVLLVMLITFLFVILPMTSAALQSQGITTSAAIKEKQAYNSTHPGINDSTYVQQVVADLMAGKISKPPGAEVITTTVEAPIVKTIPRPDQNSGKTTNIFTPKINYGGQAAGYSVISHQSPMYVSGVSAQYVGGVMNLYSDPNGNVADFQVVHLWGQLQSNTSITTENCVVVWRVGNTAYYQCQKNPGGSVQTITRSATDTVEVGVRAYLDNAGSRPFRNVDEWIWDITTSTYFTAYGATPAIELANDADFAHELYTGYPGNGNYAVAKYFQTWDINYYNIYQPSHYGWLQYDNQYITYAHYQNWTQPGYSYGYAGELGISLTG